MFHVVAYGSLLAASELERQGLNHCRAVPVVVHGFRRCFNQEPMWRQRASRERAVLSVQPLPGSRFNGLLLEGLSATELATLDKRERGYDRVTLKRTSIELARPESELNAHQPILLYCGKCEQRNDSLLPNPDYMDLCDQAARGWGQGFHRTFLQTTFVAGQSMDDYQRDTLNTPRGTR